LGNGVKKRKGERADMTGFKEIKPTPIRKEEISERGHQRRRGLTINRPSMAKMCPWIERKSTSAKEKKTLCRSSEGHGGKRPSADSIELTGDSTVQILKKLRNPRRQKSTGGDTKKRG